MILNLLRSKPGQGFSTDEVFLHVVSDSTKRLGLDKPWGVADVVMGLIAIAVLPSPKKEQEEAPTMMERVGKTLEDLVSRGIIESREYKGAAHYWAPAKQ